MRLQISLVTKIHGSLFFLMACFGGYAALSALEGNRTIARIEQSRIEQIRMSANALEILGDLQLIQHTLTDFVVAIHDVSATRALDGLDGGLKIATESAAEMRRLIMQINSRAVGMNEVEVITWLKTLRPAFDAYEKTANSLAQAYIDGGPAAGNPRMAELDQKAEILFTALQKLESIVKTAVSRDQSKLTDTLEGVIDAVTWSKTMTLSTAAAALALAMALMVYLQLGFSRPMRTLTAAIRRTADGDLETNIPSTGRGDELGKIAQSIAQFKDAMLANRHLEAMERAKAANDVIRQDEVNRHIATFQSDMDASIETLDRSGQDMNKTASALSAMSAESDSRARDLQVSAESTAANIQSVSAASVEMHSAIAQISQQITETGRIVEIGAAAAATVNNKVSALSELAQRISRVIDLIQGIAEQTNLLALNATIEAARAGASGKGFAVVAQEVKLLATQTANATGDIGTLVGSIQAAVETLFDASRDMSTRMCDAKAIAASIAAGIEQQTASAQEISAHAENATFGARELAATVSDLTRLAGRTADSATTADSAAAELTAQTRALRSSVRGFLDRVQAA